MGKRVLRAGPDLELPALHGHGVSRLRAQRSRRPPPLHRLGHGRPRRARRACACRGHAPATVVHCIHRVEPMALHRTELWLAGDVPQARGSGHHADRTAVSPRRVRRVVPDAARRLQRRRLVRSARPVAGAASRNHPGGWRHRAPRLRGCWSRRPGQRAETFATFGAGGAGPAVRDAGPVVRRADRAGVDDGARGTANALQLGHPGGDALDAVLMDHAGTSRSANRAKAGRQVVTGSR